MKKHLELNLQKLCQKPKDQQRSTSVSRQQQSWTLPTNLRISSKVKPQITPAASYLNSKKNSVSDSQNVWNLRRQTFRKSNALLSIQKLIKNGTLAQNASLPKRSSVLTKRHKSTTNLQKSIHKPQSQKIEKSVKPSKSLTNSYSSLKITKQRQKSKQIKISMNKSKVGAIRSFRSKQNSKEKSMCFKKQKQQKNTIQALQNNAFTVKKRQITISRNRLNRKIDF